MNATMTSTDHPITENIDEDDDPIDEEQLEEYREMVDNLGPNPVSNCIVSPVIFPLLYCEVQRTTMVSWGKTTLISQPVY